MGNFEAGAYIEGTAALKVDVPANRSARIIRFPESSESCERANRRAALMPRIDSAAVESSREHARVKGCNSLSRSEDGLVVSSDALYLLLNGTAAGRPSGRMSRLQAVGTFGLFAGIALVALLLGM